MLRILLPDEPKPKKEGSGKEKEKERRKHPRRPQTKERHEIVDLPPLVFDDLVTATFNRDHGDNGALTAVRNANVYFPFAKSRTESTRVVCPPDHWLVMLQRFAEDGEKKQRKVALPMNLHGKALAGFIVHKGERATSGHYVAYIEHHGAWFLLDDDQVIPAPDISGPLMDAYVAYYQ
jgi:hypothetical protein